MKWHVSLVFSDETVELDEVFDTEEEAYEYGVEMSSNYRTGMDILHMSNPGDYPIDDEVPEIEVWDDYE